MPNAVALLCDGNFSRKGNAGHEPAPILPINQSDPRTAAVGYRFDDWQPKPAALHFRTRNANEAAKDAIEEWVRDARAGVAHFQHDRVTRSLHRKVYDAALWRVADRVFNKI